MVVYDGIWARIKVLLWTAILQNDERFLSGFRGRPSYVKLLVELELLKEPLLKDNEEEATSADELAGTSSGESSVLGSPVKILNKYSGKLLLLLLLLLFSEIVKIVNLCGLHLFIIVPVDAIMDEKSNQTSEFTLSAKIIETGTRSYSQV